MNFITIIGIAASVFAALSPLPQIIKLLREKEADAISTWMFGTLLAGLSLWIWYGVLREDWILVASNSFSFLVNGFILALGIRYKKS